MKKKYNYTKKTGRPTKYNPSFIDMVDEYLATCGREQTKLPTFEGFSLFLDVSLDAMAEWRKLYPDFNGALKRIEKMQKEQLINDGIYGGKEVNSTIVKLLLQNNHGMREKSDTDITTNGKDIAPVLVKFIDNADNKNSS